MASYNFIDNNSFMDQGSLHKKVLSYTLGLIVLVVIFYFVIYGIILRSDGDIPVDKSNINSDGSVVMTQEEVADRDRILREIGSETPVTMSAAEVIERNKILKQLQK